MFNPNSGQTVKSKKKVIKVKPLESFQQSRHENSEDSTSLEDVAASIQLEVTKSQSQLNKLKEQSEQLLNETKEKIRLARKNWDEEKESYMKQANEDGYNAGYELGKAKSVEEYKQLIEHGNELTQSAIVDYHSVIEKSEQKVIDLAIHTAQKIIKMEINEKPEIFLSIVKEAIKETKNQSTISIYLHPNNYTRILKQKDELTNLLDGDTKALIYIDQDLEEGGCMINHSFGQIDASIHTQLDQIHQVLNEIYTESITNAQT